MAKRFISVGLIALALVGCGKTEIAEEKFTKVELESNDMVFTEFSRSMSVLQITANGMPCIVYNHMSNKAGITCDWTKYNPGP
ncbi:membrane lipoprotein [Vibrio phage 2.275.O._10N.286.54.E11]|nr:membrane lipoprotein [Vibrio phage 2.275.O._10N.286.54.E11]